jgi:predicted lipoprotein with Yx(FWY)xxD motif
LRRTRLAALTPIAIALLIAGCGGNNKSSSSTAAAGGNTSSSASNNPYGQSTSSSSSSATQAALITTKHDKKLGTILAYGPKHLTVYLFQGDKGQSSSCMGACASVWPPVTGKPQASAGAMSSDLGTIKRADGSTQVTYKGNPLYLYVKDKDDGDAYGEALKSFGAEWYALKSSGQKVDLS